MTKRIFKDVSLTDAHKTVRMLRKHEKKGEIKNLSVEYDIKEYQLSFHSKTGKLGPKKDVCDLTFSYERND